MSAIDAVQPFIRIHAPHDSVAALLLYNAERLSVNHYSSLLFEPWTPDDYLKQASHCSFLGFVTQRSMYTAVTILLCWPPTGHETLCVLKCVC